MEWLSSPEAWIALTTLTLLEIVLGVDNIIFISILVGRLPEAQRPRARILGLTFAMGTRILLLLLLTWIMRLQSDLFSAFGVGISGRDLILIGGGLFLIAKSTLEIHSSLEAEHPEGHVARHAAFFSVIFQIGIIDIVFSLDSVITAVGLANDVVVMIIAIVLAVIMMMFAAGAIGRFVDNHPTIKMLALSFLVLIGVALIAEGADVHVPKSYIYFAMAFSVGVESLNIKMRTKKKSAPVEMRQPYR
jgi:predicted tellurium resistance membrane protein TerC